MTEPKQKPGSSKQDYETPADFMGAVVRAFGPMVWDLAATKETSKASPVENYFGPQHDSLTCDWRALPPGNLWLNPPYGQIAPWARKAATSARNVIMLVPASIGSNWYRDWVYPYATTVALNGRLTFVGQSAPFPKDCILAMYGPTLGKKFYVWDWRKDLSQAKVTNAE